MINFHSLIAKTGSKDGARASFEEMLAQLIRLSQLGVRRVEANPGDWGIDVFVGQLDDRISVWQSKFFIDGVRETQQQEIRESLTSLIASAQAQGFTVNTWTLCIPCSMDPKATKWWDGWKKRAESKYAITVQLWDETELRNLLLGPDTNVLRETYFGLHAAASFRFTPPAAPQIPTQGPNLSASMLRQIKSVSIRPEIAREAERLLRHIDYPKIMSLGGNLVDNPVWSDIPYDEQVRLTTSRRPDGDKCPLFMVLDLFLIRANDSTGSPLLLTKHDGRRAGWKAFLFPFRKRMDKENPTIRYSSNTKQVAELLRVPDNSVEVSSLGRQYLVSVKPHPGYSELYAYVFEFCSVELTAPPRWLATISCEPRRGDEERRFHWFHLSELQGRPREWQVNADVIRAVTHFFAATKAKIPESVPEGFLR